MEMESCGRNMMDAFDDNILAEILLHLPLNLKFQCKAVCKRWYRLISTPYFAKRVFAKQQDTVPMPWYLFYQFDFFGVPNEHCPLEVAYKYNPDFTIQSFEVSCRTNNWMLPRFWAIHNGLFLFQCRHLYVFSPLTRQQASFPGPRLSNYDIKGFIVSCDNGHSKFKVVTVTGKYGEYRVHGNFKVFSSEVGEWTDTGIEWPGIGDLSHWGFVGVVHDGKLHWRVTTDTSSNIIVYDPDRNECRVLSFNVPRSVRFEDGLIGTCCGRLCFANNVSQPDDVLSVCVLENYETGEWRPLLITQLKSVLDANKIQDDTNSMEPMAFHPFDMDTIYFESLGRLVSFNLRTHKLSSLTEPLVEPYGLARDWKAYPFVLPAWPTSVPTILKDRKLWITD